MKHATQLGSGSMIYIPVFVMIDSRIQVTICVLPQQFGTLKY
jgi:hypothetical protein